LSVVANPAKWVPPRGKGGGCRQEVGLPAMRGKMKLKVFIKANCPKCSEAKEVAEKLEKDGQRVLYFDLDTVDGLAEAAFQNIRSTPSLVIEDEDEEEVIGWRGRVPPIQELRKYFGGLDSDRGERR